MPLGTSITLPRSTNGTAPRPQQAPPAPSNGQYRTSDNSQPPWIPGPGQAAGPNDYMPNAPLPTPPKPVDPNNRYYGGMPNSPGQGHAPPPPSPIDPLVSWWQSQNGILDAQQNQSKTDVLLQVQLDEARRRAAAGGNADAYKYGMAYLQQDLARLAADQALAGKQRGFTGTNYDLSNQQVNTGFDRDQRHLMSDAVARGAGQAMGVKLDYGDLVSTRDNGLARNTLNRDTANAQSDRNEAYLENLAKDYGIKADQLKSALSRGAGSMGLNAAQTLAAIAAANNSIDLDRQAAGQNLIFQLLQAGIDVSGMYGNKSAPALPAGSSRWAAER